MEIRAQLIDAGTGMHLWADRFDGAIEDIFDLQDQVTTSVVGAITPTVERAEIERAVRSVSRRPHCQDLKSSIHRRPVVSLFTRLGVQKIPKDARGTVTLLSVGLSRMTRRSALRPDEKTPACGGQAGVS
jgi:hypothetical protein